MFGLSFTYSGHPVSAAVAREALRIYEDENIVEYVRDMEPHFLGGLKKLLDHPLVGEVRGRGLLAGVEQAFQEFFADKPESIIEQPTTQCMVVKL